MATGTNGIASNSEVNAKIGSSLVPTNPDKCPTFAEILATGKANLTGGYSSNMLVKYSDITKKPPRYVIFINWGTKYIYSIQIPLYSSGTSNTVTVSFGGGIANGGQRSVDFPQAIYSTSGNISITSTVHIEAGGSYNYTFPAIASMFHVAVSAQGQTSGFTQPSSFTTYSIAGYYFAGDERHLVIHMKYS